MAGVHALTSGATNVLPAPLMVVSVLFVLFAPAAATAGAGLAATERDLANFTAGGELLVDQIFGGVKREVTDVQTIRHVTLTLWRHSRIRQTPTSRSEGEVLIALYENAAGV